MAEKKVIELEVKSDSLGSLKSQLRAAQNEVNELAAKFGATSQEAINAAKRAAELKDAIGDAKALTDAYNPDAKFNALTQSLGGVLNGFQAFEGALGLVGVESEAVQEQLLKVQSAMALSEGVAGVLESVDSFKTLSTQVSNLTIVQKISTAAQWLWNAAMAANPIGVIIVAITALIVAGYKLISWFNESADAADKANASMDRHTKALERQQKQLETQSKNLKQANQYQYDYAKAAGASSEQLRKLAIKHQEEELALAKKNLELAKSTYLREQDILASYRANDASEELIERQTEIVKKAREATTKARESLTQEYDDLKALRLQQKVEIRQEETDANKEAQGRAKEAEEKRREAANEAKEKRKEIVKETTKTIVEETRKQGEVTEEQEDFFTQMLVDADAEREGIRQESIAKQEEDELALMQFRGDLYKQDTDNYAAEEAKKEQLRKDNLASSINAVQQGFSLIAEFASQNYNQYQKISQAILSNDKLTAKEKQKQLDQNNKLAKHAFDVQKKAAIAGALIDTYKGAASAYASTPGGPIIKAASAALAVAAGLLNVRNIQKQEFEATTMPSESGGGSGAGAGAGAGGGNVITPNFNIVGNAQATNPLAGLGGQPLQAYVVSGDVTTAQSLDRNRVNNATFG